MKAFSLLLLPLLVVLAVACGSDDADPSTDEASQQTPNATAVTEPTESGSTQPASSTEDAPVLPVTVTDLDGQEVTVEDVSRIVSLNGDITEIIFALGLGDNLAGVDTSATYPEEASEKPNIGYQRSLSAEGIISLDPTLIIGTETAGPPEVIEQVRSIGIPVVLLETSATLDGAAAKIRAVAEALGVPERGEALASQTEAQIDEALALAARAESQPRVMFLYLRGSSVQMIMGEGSVGDVMVQSAGALDVAVEEGIQGSKPITPEALVAGAPDYFLVLTAGLESVGGVDGLLQIPGIAETPAGQERAVIVFEDQFLLGLGPRTGEALTELVLAFHPELSQ